MSSVFQPSYRRELLVASFDKDLHQNMLEFLCTPTHGLDLQDLEVSASAFPDSSSSTAIDVSGRTLYLQWYLQGNSKASRKQLAPLVQDFYDSR